MQCKNEMIRDELNLNNCMKLRRFIVPKTYPLLSVVSSFIHSSLVPQLSYRVDPLDLSSLVPPFLDIVLPTTSAVLYPCVFWVDCLTFCTSFCLLLCCRTSISFFLPSWQSSLWLSTVSCSFFPRFPRFLLQFVWQFLEVLTLYYYL